jgi:monoamine oxidase
MRRRRFLQAAAGTALAKPLRAANVSDVLVIGAGLAGLRAAHDLQDSGLSAQVIEGRDRAGGRILSIRDLPGNPEAGGSGIAPGYGRMIDAAQRFGVKLINVAGRPSFMYARELALDGKIIKAADWENHPRNPFTGEMRKTMPWSAVSSLMKSKNPLGRNFDDWHEPKSFHLDSSMYDWLMGQGMSEAAIELAYNTNCAQGSSAHDVSALMVAFTFSWGDVQRDFEPGAAYAAEGGNQSVPEAMAKALGDNVHYGKTVIGLRTESATAEAICADGSVYRAKKIVCSLPFAVLRTLKVDPIIGGLQGQAIDTLGVQLAAQSFLVAKNPFWLDDGLNLGLWTDGLAGSMSAHPVGEMPSDIVSFNCTHRGLTAAQLDQMPEKEAKMAIIKAIETVRPSAKGKLEVHSIKSWQSDPFSCGDWAIWQPGQVRRFIQHIAKPHGHIHFCGEHTAMSNRGMEGAMESGERAAQEVLQAL